MLAVALAVWVGLGAAGLAAPADPRLIAHWDALSATGTSLPDLAGKGHAGTLVGVTAMRKVEELVEHPCLYFDGKAGHVVVPTGPALNPGNLTILAWVNVRADSIADQKPIVVKSLKAHTPPWYQYGLFLMDNGEKTGAVSCYLSVGGKLQQVEVLDTVEYDTWCLAGATWDGKTQRLFWNGKEVAAKEGTPGPIDPCDTPVLLGAYGNLPRTDRYCFAGLISAVRLYSAALAPEEMTALYAAEKSAYPASVQKPAAAESEYARGLNDALRQGRDVWGEDLIAKGGATAENIEGFLHPLFLSTGHKYTEPGVHNLVFGEDGGAPPYLIPLADGSRIAATIYNSPHYLEFGVGADGADRFGSDLDRLAGPLLDNGYYPILQTRYTDAGGNVFAQESLAARIPGVKHLVAQVRFTVKAKTGSAVPPVLTVKLGAGNRGLFRCSGTPAWSADSATFTFAAGAETPPVYLLWSPQDPLPTDLEATPAVYEAAKTACRTYWDAALARGAGFEVPEKLAMDAQHNLLIQNLIMRWRYTLGPVVYHGDFYQPEGSDACSTLGLYGFLDAYRDGLAQLLPMTKGAGYYVNWERGEKLTHGAHYYFLSRDAAFVAQHTPAYLKECDELRAQMAKDPNGLLEKQRHCGDIPTAAYCTFHDTVCWRGLRDLAQVWKLTGRQAEAATYGAAAASLEQAVHKALDASTTWLPDGSYFVPTVLLDKTPPYDPITETKLGSYWNLCMPYAFSSGFWAPGSRELGGILNYMHNHGGILLGLLRFNYYPVAIGAHKSNGLPGYGTTGYDNVYLPGYLRMLSDRDEADRLVVSFYGKLVHGQTRNTFVNGEGETVGEVPGERYRSCYGTPNSANNTAYLLALRLMLVRESFDQVSGEPAGLFLADATPREWLASGKQITVRNAPTCFGPLSYALVSRLDQGLVEATVELPQRDPIRTARLKLRVPAGRRLTAGTVNGQAHPRFDPAKETIDLTGLTGKLAITAQYR